VLEGYDRHRALYNIWFSKEEQKQIKKWDQNVFMGKIFYNQI